MSGLSVMSLNMFLPSLANMAESFNTDYALVSISIAGYLGVTATLQLILGPLSDRYGRRPVVLCGIAVFTCASVVCFLSTSIEVFLIFRMLQGSVSAGIALSSPIVRDTTPANEAASKIGYLAMGWAVAPMIAPMLGGVLDEQFGWRSNFMFFTLAGIIVLIICWFDLGETNQQRSSSFSEQFRSYPDLFRSRRFWGYALCATFSVGTFFIFIVGAPLIAQEHLDLSAAQLGFFIGSITIGFIFGNFLSGRYASRFALTTMMITGRIVAIAGLCAGLFLFSLGYVNEWTVFGTTIFSGIGNGLTSPSTNSGVLSVRPKLAGSASGLSGAILVGGGALLSSLSGSVITAFTSVYALHVLMLISAAIGLIAAWYVLYVDKQMAQLEAA